MEIFFLSVTSIRQDSIYIYIDRYIYIYIYSGTTIIIILMTTIMIQQGKDFNENSIYTYEGDFNHRGIYNPQLDEEDSTRTYYNDNR